MSLWRTWEFYESFTFFVSAKEYRSKTDVTHIEKTNTNIACNNCQAKYGNSKCKTASSDDLHSIEVDWYEKKLYFGRFDIFRNAKDWACNSSSVSQRLHSKLCLSPFVQTLEWLHTLSLPIYFTSYLSHPSLGHIRTKCAFVDNFEFAANKAFDVCIGMSMLFIGQFLEIS